MIFVSFRVRVMQAHSANTRAIDQTKINKAVPDCLRPDSKERTSPQIFMKPFLASGKGGNLSGDF